MAVGHLQGTNEIEADVDTQTVRVTYDPSEVTVEAIQQRMVSIGYESTVLD